MASFCRVVFALVERGALLPVGRLTPVPSARWSSRRDSVLKIGEHEWEMTCALERPAPMVGRSSPCFADPRPDLAGLVHV